MKNVGMAARLHPLIRASRWRVRQAPLRPPTVSVIIPNYNYAHYLPGAVQSALRQTGVLTDVIVVDDASTDQSVEAAEALVAADPRVRLIARSRNGGPVATFNEGLAAARGEYLVRLDADDLLTPGSLARAAALAEQFPNVGLVYGHPVHFGAAVPVRYRDLARTWLVWRGSEWLEFRCRLGVNCITSPEVLMRSSVVRSVGGQRALAHTHDMEMWFRIARESDVGWLGGCDQAWHREHPDSLSATEVDLMTDFHERAAAFEMLLTDGRGDPAQDAIRLRTARSALADEAIQRTSSAYARGRGGTAETDGYLKFAGSLDVELTALPHAGVCAKALRLGPRRAARSPSLLASAVLGRAVNELGRLRWRAKGI